MTDQYSPLEEAARKATPGPWVGTSCLDAWVETEDGKGVAQTGNIDWIGSSSLAFPTEEGMKANAAYIAAADPDTVIALIERVRTLEGEHLMLQVLDALEAARDKMRGAVEPDDVRVYEQVTAALAALNPKTPALGGEA